MKRQVHQCTARLSVTKGANTYGFVPGGDRLEWLVKAHTPYHGVCTLCRRLCQAGCYVRHTLQRRLGSYRADVCIGAGMCTVDAEMRFYKGYHFRSCSSPTTAPSMACALSSRRTGSRSVTSSPIDAVTLARSQDLLQAMQVIRKR